MNPNKIVILAGYALMSWPVAMVMGWWAVLFMAGLGLMAAGNREAAREEAIRGSDANIKAYLKGRGF